MSVVVDIDLRSLLAPARNQGQRPTCLAFAVTAAHEASRSCIDYLSTEHLFCRGVQRFHRDPRRSLNQVSVARALHEDGQPDETAWPYSEAIPHLAMWAPPATIKTLYKATIVFSRRTVDEVRSVIQAGAPVVLVVSVTMAMYRPDTEGIVRPGPTDVTTACRHALVAVGSGHTSDGSAYLLVRNSWGSSWGDQGHGWLRDPYLAAHLQDTGVIHGEGPAE